MKIDKVNNDRVLIGERVLRREDGGPEVTVKVFLPVKDKDNDEAFRCYYQICGIGNEGLRFGTGIDAIQAIQIALKNIGADLYLRHKDVRLIFGDVNDPGFPPPKLISGGSE